MQLHLAVRYRRRCTMTGSVWPGLPNPSHSDSYSIQMAAAKTRASLGVETGKHVNQRSNPWLLCHYFVFQGIDTEQAGCSLRDMYIQ